LPSHLQHACSFWMRPAPGQGMRPAVAALPPVTLGPRLARDPRTRCHSGTGFLFVPIDALPRPEAQRGPVGGRMTAVLQQPTLVLNRNWQPVHVATVARALVLL